MARVLVTGASGFLGRFIPGKLVARGHEVHLVGRNLGLLEFPNLSLPLDCVCHSVDILDIGSVGALISIVRPTHLLHLAWYTEPGLYWHSPKNLEWLAASQQLFRAFSQAGGQRFVGAGTCAEYDWSHPILSPEITPLNPLTPYGEAKARLFEELSRDARNAGVSFGWGRVFFPFGPWEHPTRLLPNVINGLLSGTPVHLTEGNQVRDFIYSEDAAQIFVDLLEKGYDGAVNVASGQGLSIRSFVKIVLSHLHHPELLRFGTRPLGNDTTPYMVADVSALKAKLGAQMPVGLELGIQRTVEWWKKERVIV